MIKVGIIGGSGYTAGELIRILMFHPNATLDFVYSTTRPNTPLSDTHQDLLGSTNLNFTDENSIEKNKYPQSKIIVDKDGYGGLNLAVEISKELLKKNSAFNGDVLDHPDLYFSFPSFASLKDKENIYAEWLSFVKQHPFSDLQKWSNFIGNSTSQGSIKVPEIDRKSIV